MRGGHQALASLAAVTNVVASVPSRARGPGAGAARDSFVPSASSSSLSPSPPSSVPKARPDPPQLLPHPGGLGGHRSSPGAAQIFPVPTLPWDAVWEHLALPWDGGRDTLTVSPCHRVPEPGHGKGLGSV